ncbi:MAPEG family protein [Alteromonas sp. A079]|jgi:hypothetical protein|uniref:MAPEG family protein n=1 Tax=Alteromonas sp. A079 TaxID=3410268 RepID=UPI003B9F5EAE
MNTLLLPMFSHVSLCALLYALLTITRAPSVWGVGAKASGPHPFDTIQPKISANLSNQFEWPLFFYVICVLLLITGTQGTAWYGVLAWVFVVGRIVHSAVHIFTANVRLRGVVFTINFVAVITMWIMFVVDMLAV